MMKARIPARAVSTLIVALLIALSSAPTCIAQGRASPGIPAREFTDVQAYEKAEQGLISDFRDRLMKTSEFTDSFGAIAWEDISREVADSLDIVRDRKSEKAEYGDAVFLFTGSIYECYAEIAIDRTTGEVRKVIIELE
jgi:hypothetical protein